MPYFSLKMMLQKSLNSVFYQVASAGGAGHPAPSPDFRAFKAATLHLRRNPQPLEYVSPLPQQLAASLNRPISTVTSQVLAEFQRAKTALLPEGMSCQEQAVLQRVKALPTASGQLGLQLDQPGLMLWLKRLAASPWPAAFGPGLVGAQVGARSHLSQQLQLSPLALLQHTQARCRSLLAAASPPGPAPEAPDGAADAASCDLRMVIWALADLVDGLATDGVTAAALLRQGCQLSEAVYDWLRAVPQSKVDSPSAYWALQAVQQTLQHLLEQRWGCSAPGSL
jgi:hypothetical protein